MMGTRVQARKLSSANPFKLICKCKRCAKVNLHTLQVETRKNILIQYVHYFQTNTLVDGLIFFNETSPAVPE